MAPTTAAAPVRNRRKKIDKIAPYCENDVEGRDMDDADVDLILQPVEIHQLVEEKIKEDEKEKENDDNDFPMLSAQEQIARSNANNSSKEGEASNVDSSNQIRRIAVPPHRYTPLRKHWEELVDPIVKHMKLQIRMNVKRRCVELRTSPSTPQISFLQKAADFVRSFMLGFDIQDGIALLRLDDLFLESFEISDVKRLVGDHLSRAIGRISGREGKTKHAIENATRTRIVLADSYVHILGAFQNIRLARNSICALIIGSPPSKIYNRLRTVSRRLQEL